MTKELLENNWGLGRKLGNKKKERRKKQRKSKWGKKILKLIMKVSWKFSEMRNTSWFWGQSDHSMFDNGAYSSFSVNCGTLLYLVSV